MIFHLPIADVSVNFFTLLAIGGGVGFLSGLFGVGGGFLMTPLLIFIGIPPAVAVGTEASQITASSVSGMLVHWRRGNVDFKMGAVLLIGGVAGTGIGMIIFSLLRSAGQIELTISLLYVVFLGIIGILMLVESLKATFVARRRGGSGSQRKLHQHNWLHGLPLKMRFRRSKLYISAFLPVSVGFLVGILAVLMGVGGGFIMVPAMIYLLGMPTSVVVGTSLFQILFVTASATMLHATSNQTVDIVLAMLLMIGGVVGAQYGARVGTRLQGEELRALLAIIVLAVCGKLAWDLVVQPDELFSIKTVIH